MGRYNVSDDYFDRWADFKQIVVKKKTKFLDLPPMEYRIKNDYVELELNHIELCRNKRALDLLKNLIEINNLETQEFKI